MEEEQKISPVFKVNYHTDPQNDRSISVLPALSKVCEKIVYDHLYAHVKEHDIWPKYQSVFFSSLHINNFARCNKWMVF